MPTCVNNLTSMMFGQITKTQQAYSTTSSSQISVCFSNAKYRSENPTYIHASSQFVTITLLRWYMYAPVIHMKLLKDPSLFSVVNSCNGI